MVVNILMGNCTTTYALLLSAAFVTSSARHSGHNLSRAIIESRAVVLSESNQGAMMFTLYAYQRAHGWCGLGRRLWVRLRAGPCTCKRFPSHSPPVLNFTSSLY